MKRLVPILLVFCFLLLLLLGIGFGEVAEVIMNATLLCLSCIGIG